MKTSLRIYSDGASRGNPGPSATAFMIIDEDGRILKRYSKYVGVGTNNQAEYEALIAALEFASGITNQEIVCYMDSELVVKQLNGKYRVRNALLRPRWLKVQELKPRFQRISFFHVSREDAYIQRVDRLANQVLDRTDH